MMRRIKYLLPALLLMLSVLLMPTPVQANSMESLDIKVDLQQDGSGIVTQNRKMTMDRDTEIYIVLNNLGGSKVTDFQVSDFGQPLTYQPNWDIKASREEKAGKFGIVETEDGYELCWGIGEYGSHEYTVTYTLTGMVRQLKDGQSMIWTLYDGKNNILPQTLTLAVNGPFAFATDNTKIWGFGFAGEIFLENGSLTGKSDGPLSDSNYVTLLMQFTGSPFQPTLSLNKTLAEQEAEAKEGSSYGQDGESQKGWGGFLAAIGANIFWVLALVAFMFTRLTKRSQEGKATMMSAKERENLNKDKYHRDIPYEDGPITDVAYMLQNLKMGNIQDYFNTFILNWIRDGHIDHITEEKGLIFKKDESVIQLNRGQVEGLDLESRFWNMMQLAAGQDNKLEEKEFSKWARRNYQQVSQWEKDLREDSTDVMTRKGYLQSTESKLFGIFPTTTISSTPTGETMLNQIIQFRNYLNDFSLVSEREAVQVKLWDKLLVWASLFGIAEAVAKQMEKLYPQYLQESGLTMGDLVVAHAFSNSFASGYHSGVSAASGGGGSTSIGGGGGSFGGGGGGSR